jgi:hypothetical protein
MRQYCVSLRACRSASSIVNCFGPNSADFRTRAATEPPRTGAGVFKRGYMHVELVAAARKQARPQTVYFRPRFRRGIDTSRCVRKGGQVPHRGVLAGIQCNSFCIRTGATGLLSPAVSHSIHLLAPFLLFRLEPGKRSRCTVLSLVQLLAQRWRD